MLPKLLTLVEINKDYQEHVLLIDSKSEPPPPPAPGRDSKAGVEKLYGGQRGRSVLMGDWLVWGSWRWSD